MKPKLMYLMLCVALLTSLMYAVDATKQIPDGGKAKITGQIISRNGNLMLILEKKDDQVVAVNLNDDPWVEQKKGGLRLRHTDWDATTLVPGLTVTVKGVGNADGQLEASEISFHDPNAFAIEVAEEQQITANQAATATAQNTANNGVQDAQTAQSSANEAQASANQAGNVATAATAAGVKNAEDIETVNTRVSELGDYKTVAEAGVYFATDSAELDSAAKADLDKVAQLCGQTENCMIEVAGYASSTGSTELNQKLSSDRAAAVVRYLRNEDNVPMERIMARAGYGASHFVASNSDAQGRAMNQRVDVRILVNKGLQS